MMRVLSAYTLTGPIFALLLLYIHFYVLIHIVMTSFIFVVGIFFFNYYLMSELVTNMHLSWLNSFARHALSCLYSYGRIQRSLFIN